MTRQRKHEAPELGSAVRRMLDALTVRATEGDLEAIEELAKLQDAATDALGLAIAGARANPGIGYSWAQIAQALGVSRQGAFQRFGSYMAPDLVKTPCGLPKLTQRAAAAHARQCQDCRQVGAA